MTILVTGGTGFLASYFTRYVLDEGGEERVVVFDKHLDLGRIADVLDRVTVIEGDVTDFAAVQAAIEDHAIDRIAHFAFILGSPSPGNMIPYVGIQTLGVTHVLEAARRAGVARVLFCSSVAAYGEQEAATLTEDMLSDPMEPYGFSKTWGEALARHYTRRLGLDTVSLRFGSTYGFGRARRGSYSSGLLAPPGDVHYLARIEQALAGQPIEMPNDTATADFAYAADAAQAVWLALTAETLPHRLYNMASERRSIGDFTRVLRAVLPDAAITVRDDLYPGNPHAPMDGTRLREDLGYRPRYSLEAGLRDYLHRVRVYERYHRDARVLADSA